ncbi:TPA: cell division protein FtsA [Candidatus Campbellbacteria bacterium]|nr:MAG: cell division protein FtsA, cell division protein FtsA [Candidatus Campbellbacteria bacterium GW2011_OD1_34_28]KKP74964.1 MAG: Cell division protein ftsA [Candidatus Campbellbacteria bacterium GW2011_GWD2_35_24]KKP75850.1 MAG: cell division protein FtsA, cell division protein FtsA [Candidatus Campbellbacteria bacterium GW2011_GWC2_35_28]KKP76902.1 MAG: Cell division protein ftsA [Candidatus Campbellbacteria bacterium GW2011_GWC1_35_31]KKP78828.1 MAG: Cell division protein ftsA [Candidat
MSKKNSVGIDIGTHQIKVVVAELIKEKSKDIPRIIGRGSSESKGLRHGYIINQSDVSKSLERAVKQAERSSGIKIKKAYLSIGGVSLEGITTVGSTISTKGDYEITELDIQKAIRSAENNVQLLNKRIIHRVPLSYKIDGQKVFGRPQGIKGKKMEIEVLFITYLKQHLEDLINAVEEIGIEVEDIVAAPIAAGIVTLTKSQKMPGCVLANLGSETVSIIVYENNTPISLEIFPIGSTNITNDIALGLKISLEEAEKIKTGVISNTSYPKKKLDDIIFSRLAGIFQLIEAHLKKIGRNGLLPGGIILTGGGSGITTIEDIAKAYLKLPSKVASINLITNTNAKIKDSTWTVAYGLCVLGLNSKDEGGISRGFKNIKEKLFGWLRMFSI